MSSILTKEYIKCIIGVWNGDTSPLSRRSVENIWTAIRSFYNWAEAELSIPRDARPDIGLKRPRYAPSEIDPYTEDELKALLKACEYTTAAATEKRRSFAMKRPTADRDVALLLVLLDTGIRSSECARLQIDNVVLDTGEVRVKSYGSGQKTHSRSVYLGKSARHALWKYLSKRSDTETNLFITEQSRPMNRSSIRHMISRAGKRANVISATTHRFRHTFAVQYLRNGGDVFTLQRLLGHSTLDMVRRYVALASTDDATVHRRASPVDNWRL